MPLTFILSAVLLSSANEKISDSEHLVWVTSYLMPLLTKLDELSPVVVGLGSGQKPFLLTESAMREFEKAANSKVQPASRDARLEDTVSKDGKFVRGRKISERQHWNWLKERRKQLAEVKPGMTRRELYLRVTEDGGLNSAFRSRQCEYLKIRVKFETEGASEPNDKVTAVSVPYLQVPFID